MANGGKIVDLDDPKLTHVVLDKRDTARRKKLMKQTSRYVFISVNHPVHIGISIYNAISKAQTPIFGPF